MAVQVNMCPMSAVIGCFTVMGALLLLPSNWISTVLALLFHRTGRGLFCGGSWKFILVALCTCKRDFLCLLVLLRVRLAMYQNARRTIPALFAKMAARHPDKPALIYEPTGEKVHIMVIDLSFSHYRQDAVFEIRGSLHSNMVLFCSGEQSEKETLADFKVESLDELLACAPRRPPSCTLKKTFNDRLFYIYTSGTTGMPKAAVVVHSRYFRIAAFGFHAFGLRGDDIIYDCLPLYHSAGTIMGVGQCLLFGATVVIRSKFSASRFWDDCVKHNCTVGLRGQQPKQRSPDFPLPSHFFQLFSGDPEAFPQNS
ncbi:long-chain fatty acid transport protein 4-like [Nerophis lumbriciformis]|uniref:long-chain fatty acid transport protein 4-like n=1 Tax=Nerophis lumbriciformis TaxID=546530 RepID=UPI003BAD4F2B